MIFDDDLNSIPFFKHIENVNLLSALNSREYVKILESFRFSLGQLEM